MIKDKETELIQLQNQIFHENFLFNNILKKYLSSLTKADDQNSLINAYKIIVNSVKEGFVYLKDRIKKNLFQLEKRPSKNIAGLMVSGIAVGIILGKAIFKMYEVYKDKKAQKYSTETYLKDNTIEKKLIQDFIDDSSEYLLKLFLDENILQIVFYKSIEKLKKEHDIKSIILSYSIDDSILKLDLKEKYIAEYNKIIEYEIINDLSNEFINNIEVKQNKKKLKELFVKKMIDFTDVIKTVLDKKIYKYLRTYMLDLKRNLEDS